VSPFARDWTWKKADRKKRQLALIASSLATVQVFADKPFSRKLTKLPNYFEVINPSNFMLSNV